MRAATAYRGFMFIRRTETGKPYFSPSTRSRRADRKHHPQDDHLRSPLTTLGTFVVPLEHFRRRKLLIFNSFVKGLLNLG